MASSWPSDDAERDRRPSPYHMGRVGEARPRMARRRPRDDQRSARRRRSSIGSGRRARATSGCAGAPRQPARLHQKTDTVFPPEGADPNYYYSGQGNDIDNYDAPVPRAALGFGHRADVPRPSYDIEDRLGLRLRRVHPTTAARRWHTRRRRPVHRRPTRTGRTSGPGHHGDLGRMGRRDLTTLPAGATAHRVPVLDRRRRGPARASRSTRSSSDGGPVDDATEPVGVDVRRVHHSSTDGQVTKIVLPLLPGGVAHLRPQRHRACAAPTSS